MPQGKFHPYENDVRVPFMIRGPGIAAGSTLPFLGTHVDIMPTLLGLIGGGDETTNTIPWSMDGSNLAPQLLQKRENDGRSFVIIEYLGLGDVVRYGHLEDTHNNTFRALRVLDNTQPPGLRNLKYVEFTDCKTDWNFTGPPMELELFDLDGDPYEMNNIVSEISPSLLRRFQQILRKMFRCRGDGCRAMEKLSLNDSLVAQLL